MLAECCVFSKQSQPPGHCGPPRLDPQGASPTTGAPSPEVTVLFCRVPSPGFSPAPEDTLLAHLCRFRVRLHTTCRLEAFPGSRAFVTSIQGSRRPISGWAIRICQDRLPTSLNRHYQSPADIAFSVPPSQWRAVPDYSPVSHRLRLSASP